MDRLTVQEAARRLGVTEQAIRKRIKRGTLPSEREEGRVYVWLDEGYEPGPDEVANPASDALISRMQSEIEYLRSENQRKDAILLSLSESVKALRAPGEPSEGEEPAEPAEGSDSSTQRPWWRRLFGR